LRKDAQPALTMAIPVKAGCFYLEDLVPSDVFVGASLILRQGGRFLFRVRPIKEEQGRPLIELTGIGGALEAVDETYSLGVLREVRGEIGCAEGHGAGCQVKLVPCGRTLVVRARKQMEWAELQGSERPAALVYRHHRTPPRQPWHGGTEGRGCLIVYLADLEGPP